MSGRRAWGWVAAAIVALALGLRLWLAGHFHGNYDQESYELVQGIFRRGGNVYAETERYNYSPLWFYVLGGLDSLGRVLGLPSSFVIRAALTAVDAVTVAVLVDYARRLGRSGALAAVLFAASPASILITGFHGQFDNLAVLGMLVAAWASVARPASRLGPWVAAALGVLVKHIVAFAPLFVLNLAFRDGRARVLAWGAIAATFAASFLPFLPAGWPGIRDHVLGYASAVGSYGLSAQMPYVYFLYALVGNPLKLEKGILIGALLGAAYLCRRTSPERAGLVCMLVFLTFTPGFAVQYVVLPLAFGALCPSWPFALYTLVASLYVVGHPFNLAWAPLGPPLNGQLLLPLWGSVCLWLGTELWRLRGERPDA